MNGMDIAVATPLGSFTLFVAMWVPMMAANGSFIFGRK
jgi:hypothetical protein